MLKLWVKKSFCRQAGLNLEGIATVSPKVKGLSQDGGQTESKEEKKGSEKDARQ